MAGIKFLSDIKLEPNSLLTRSNEVGTWQLSGKEVDVDDWDTAPEALWFKPDGTKMFVLGRSGDDINEFALSTAWDIENATFTNRFYIGGSPSSETNPYGLYFSPDGTKFYVVGHTMDQVLQYSCSTAWDITTAAYVREAYLPDDGSNFVNPHGIHFKPDGTEFYVLGAAEDKIKQYTLSTAWDISTISEGDGFSLIGFFEFDRYALSEASGSIGSSDDLFFSEDGKKIWIADATYDSISELVLSTAWDITSATYNGRTAKADRRYHGEVAGLYVSEENGTAYITGASDDFVRELNIGGVVFDNSNKGGVYFKNGIQVRHSLDVEGFLNANYIQTDTFTAYSTFSTYGTTNLTHGNGGTVNILDSSVYTGPGLLDILTNTYWGANSTDQSLQDSYHHNINLMRPRQGAKTTLNIGAKGDRYDDYLVHSGVVKVRSFAQEFTHSGFLEVGQALKVTGNADLEKFDLGGTTLVLDNFTESTEVDLENHTPDTGAGWTEVFDSGNANTVKVRANVGYAQINSTDSNDGIIYLSDTRPTSVNYEVRWDFLRRDSSDDTFTVIIKYKDANNYIGLRWSASYANCQLYKVEGGTTTALISNFNYGVYSSTSTNQATALKVRYIDDKIMIWDIDTNDYKAFRGSIDVSDYFNDGDGGTFHKVGFGIGDLFGGGYDGTTEWWLNKFELTDLPSPDTLKADTVHYIDNGSFGIGTTTPAANFHVDGTIRFEDLTSGILKVDADGDLSVDSNTYSTATGVEDNADVTDTANVVAALTAGTNVQIAANGTISATDTNTQLTTAQVRGKVSGTGLISYNSSTGVFSTTANNYSLPLGSSTTRGGFKIGYTESGKNYPVELSSEKMFVNVPWTDTQLTDAQVRSKFSAGSNVSITNGTISATNTDTVTSVGVSGSETTGTITLTAAGATTLTQSGQTIEIRSTDTNTTYTVGDGGLTQKNFTTTLKNKLDGIAANANNYSLPANIPATSVAIGGTVTLTESSDRNDLLYINSSTSTWGGLQIGNTANEFIFSLMGDGTTGGIYDDQNGDWIIQWTENGGSRLYHNGGQKLTTTSTGITITGEIVTTGGNSTNWNTAYGWGNHATQGYATQTYVNEAVSNLVDSAPAALDTLNELAAALGDDANFSTTMTTALGNRLRIDTNAQGLTSTQKSNGRTNLGLGTLATLNTVNASTITDNSVGAAELNVTGNGSNGQVLTSDGDGTFSWTAKTTNTDTITSVGINGSETAGTVTLTGAGATTITQSGGAIEIRSTDTNTTYTVGDGGLTQKNFTSTLKTKLDGIEAGATADQTPAQILTAIKTVDGSGTGLDADLLDGNHASAFATAAQGSTADAALARTGGNVTGNIVIDQSGDSGAISYLYSGGTYVPKPNGASYTTTNSSHTGAIAIKLPTASWNTSDMISFNVDIFDYAGGSVGESVSLYVYGYQYSTGNWTNSGAVVLSDRTDRDYTVRFGHDGTRHIVYIGETTSTWNYLQIAVRDFQAGYSAGSATRYDDGWAIAVNQTSHSNVQQTSSSNYPVAKQFKTARNIALSGAVTGNANFDGSGNITIATTATSDPTLTLAGDASGSATFTNLGNATLTVTVANDSHTHDGRYYTETEVNNLLANYSTTDHVHSAATTSANGFMSSTDKTKLDGIAASANNYSLPAGSSTVRGGFKIGYTENGKNYPVEVTSEKMYVNVPWTDTNTDTITSVGVSGSETNGTITLTGAGATTITQSGGAIEIRSTDTNTTYTVGDGGLTQKNFTTTLKNKLDGIAASANNYSHPTHPGDDFSVDTGALSGFNVVSDIDINVTTDTLGHVTDANGSVSTRQLANLRIPDTRAAEISPNDYLDNALSLDFTDEFGSLGAWYSGITLKGWSDGYAAWQLIGNATNNTNDQNLYYRTGTSTTWGTMHKVYHSGNLTAGTNVSISSGGVISATDTNTTYTVGDGGLTQKNFTTTLKTKLDGIEASADVTDTANVVAALTAGSNISISAAGSISATNTDTVTSVGVSGSETTGTITLTAAGATTLTQSGQTIEIRSTDTDTTYTVGDGGLTQKNFTSTLKTKLDGIAAGAEVNVQSDWNATTGDALILNKPTIPTNNNQLTNGAGYSTASGVEDNADVTDTANVVAALTAGTNVQIAANGTISATDTDTVYVHPTSAGNKHIPTGGAAGQFLKYSSSGTAVWATPSYTTNTDTNYYLNGITRSGNTLTFSVNGATNRTYTFGSNAFSSATYDNYNDWKLVANDDTASNVRSANYVKFDGATINGTGSQSDPYIVSATGPQGPQGPAGADGADGTNGSDGADGANGAMYGPDKYLFTTGQTYTSSGAVISIASQDINGSTNTSLASNRITFGSAGTYMVSWNINWQSLYANRSTFGATAKLNGTTIQGSNNIQYFRYNTYGHKSTTGTTFAVTVTANQYMEFKTFLHAGAANHKVTSTDGDDGAITITRIV